MRILDELYHKWYDAYNQNWKEDRELCREYEEALELAEEVLGREAGDHLHRVLLDYVDMECSQSFQEGFRLGVLLTLEVIAPTLKSAAPQGL